MADDIEVEITIPDEAETDANNNGIADGIELGQAIERADNAEESAEIAEINSDVALVVADSANQTAWATEERVAAMEAERAADREAIAQLQSVVAGLVQITENLSNVALADLEAEQFEELPPDEPPANNHWLNKPLFGGKRA